MTATLEMRGIGKSFAGVPALIDAGLVVRSGEAHALMGANGAGKSTLMNVLGGIVARDTGEIRIDGRPVAIAGPREARAAGIAFVHQELSMFDNLDVAANVLMGRESLRGGPLRLVDRRACQGRDVSVCIAHHAIDPPPLTRRFWPVM